MHSTQKLHQRTTVALKNIAISFSSQENQHFINDIPTFKAKDPLSFDDCLEQNNKVASIITKDPYKLALAKSQGSFSRIISPFLPSMGWNKIKERLCYNLGSVATKQHVVSMLTDQQWKPTETLQEYVQQFLDLLLKSCGLLPHQAKDLAHITHFIGNLHNQKLQHYVLIKKSNLSPKCYHPNAEKGCRIMHYWRLT